MFVGVAAIWLCIKIIINAMLKLRLQLMFAWKYVLSFWWAMKQSATVSNASKVADSTLYACFYSSVIKERNLHLWFNKGRYIYLRNTQKHWKSQIMSETKVS